MGQLIQGGAFFLLGAGSFLCGLLAWRIWRGNHLEYDRNHELTGSVRKAVFGDIATDRSQDYRVSAAVAQARAEGARQMQERACQAALNPGQLKFYPTTPQAAYRQGRRDAAASIRALPPIPQI